MLLGNLCRGSGMMNIDYCRIRPIFLKTCHQKYMELPKIVWILCEA